MSHAMCSQKTNCRQACIATAVLSRAAADSNLNLMRKKSELRPLLILLLLILFFSGGSMPTNCGKSQRGEEPPPPRILYSTVDELFISLLRKVDKSIGLTCDNESFNSTEVSS